jgi:hypothetical protein
MVRLHRIESSGIRRLGYDPETHKLWVQYPDGDVYEYSEVSLDLYERLLEAQPHPWSAHGLEVKSHHYRQVR